MISNMRAMKTTRAIAIGILLLMQGMVFAATYTLPDDAGTGPFNNCSLATNVLTCSTTVTLGLNDIVNISQDNLVWIIEGDLLLSGSGISINLTGSNKLFIRTSNRVVGNFDNIAARANLFSENLINIRNNLQWEGNIQSNGSITFNNNATVIGNITTSQQFNFASGYVYGTCTATGGNFAANCQQITPTVSPQYCESFDLGIPPNWPVTTSANGVAEISHNTALVNSSPGSLTLRSGDVRVRSNNFDLSPASYSSVNISFWIRRGTNSLGTASERPDAGEHFDLYYLDNTSTWIYRGSLLGEGTDGQAYNINIPLGSNVIHSNFAFELRLRTANEVNGDFWHIDDVCITPQIIVPSPTLEYRFDETHWFGSPNEVKDSSGNSTHATADAASDTTTSTDAVMCSAANLNGIDQYIESPGLGPLRTTSTLSFWIKTPNGYSGTANPWTTPVVTGYEEAGGGDDIFWGYFDQNGKISTTKGNTQTSTSNKRATINDNRYHHVVSSWDSTTGETNVYIDGALDHSYTSETGDVTYLFKWIGLVEDSGGSLVYLNALIDEFVVFDSILTPEQVAKVNDLQKNNQNLDGSARVCEPPPQFRIIHSGTAQTCQDETIAIEIRDSAGNLITGYDKTVTFSTTTASTGPEFWGLVTGTNASSFTDNGDGTATYKFEPSDNGRIEISYANYDSNDTTVNFNVTDGSLSESSSYDPTVTFTANEVIQGSFRDEFQNSALVYRDEFETVSYSNNDGRGGLNWATDWIESDRVGGSQATGGDVRINNGHLELTGNDTSGGSFIQSSAEREVDLSSYTSASLRYTIQSTEVESNDTAVVEVSDDGGATWTILVTYTDDIPSWKPKSHDISAFISSNTRIRFRIVDQPGSTCCYGPANEILEIEDVEIIVDDSGSFSGNNGTLNFTAPWIESEAETQNSPSNGPISIYLDRLHLFGSSNANSPVWIERNLDLQAYDKATLTFDYAARGNVDAQDEAKVQIFNGSSWVDLQVFSGLTSGTANIDISSFMSSNTRFRFFIDSSNAGGTECCYDGNDEYFVIDNVDIEVSTVPQCTPPTSGPDHFSFSHDGNGINCATESITLTARNSDGTVFTTFAGDVDLSVSTSDGDWSHSSAGKVTNGSANNGQATVTFTTSDSGVVVLTYANTEPQTLNFNALYNSAVSEQSGNAPTTPRNDDPSMTFARSGFQFLDSTNSVISRVNVTAGLLADLKVQVVESDPNTNVCVPLFSNASTKDITMGTTCTTPNSCYPGEKVEWTNGSVNDEPLPNPENLEGGLATQSNPVVFSADSLANFRLKATDIGEQNLSLSYELTDIDGNPTSQFITGNLRLLSSPASLAIASVANASGNAPNGTDPFAKAGENFTTTLQALDSDGNPVSSFGRVAGLHNVLWDNTTLAGPIGGTTGNITGDSVGASSGGQWQGIDTDGNGSLDGISFLTGNGISYSEVGDINLIAEIYDFMGFGTNLVSNSVSTGRFTPAYLQVTEVNPNTATWGDGSSIYQGQDTSLTGLTYDVVAYDINGNVLTNYVGNYVDFGNKTDSLEKDSSQSSTGGDLTSSLAWTVSNDGDFDGTIRLTGDFTNVNWARNATGPTADDVLQTIGNLLLTTDALTDEDGICVQSSASGSCETTTADIADRSLYFGRLVLPSQVNGTDQDADIPVTLEYLSSYSGSEPIFSVQTTESDINNSLITGLNYNSGLCTISGCPASGTSTADLADGTFSGPAGTGTSMVNGLGQLSVNSSTSLQGLLEANAQIPSWLTWYWDGDANNNGVLEASELSAASTIILFGQYQGRQPILFTRPGFR
ncbi:hypothetical protein QWZ13_16465 [Reinekea marina]|uniref:DUF6701 domain-containing protein n=1 Tax=Reinekea marina TaxID=1310421 RepID=A0ABV7WQY3_9GAMM|nr:DUF6701 domain-containing protein [Reinekea marina]MDN3650502.1 hypothetical protein [Reinekea marina]